MSGKVFVLDACVLYPAFLRDLLMYLNIFDLYQPKWTDRIHDEWIRNVLLNRPDINKSQLERTRELMNENARDSLVRDYEDLIEDLSLPDKDDRHVLAAALKSRANGIVTFNLKDFPASTLDKYGIKIFHPDDFLMNLLMRDKVAFLKAARKQREGLRLPPKTVDEYLSVMRKQGLPKTVSVLEENKDFI